MRFIFKFDGFILELRGKITDNLQKKCVLFGLYYLKWYFCSEMRTLYLHLHHHHYAQ